MSFFSKIFRKKKLKSPVDLSVLEVDLHSHILPGIDDGAADFSVSVDMVKQLHGFGFRKIITTPHIMSDLYKNTPDRIFEVMKVLEKELEDKKIKANIEVAAEYMFDDGLINHIESYKPMTFGSNYILIELPYFTEPPKINDTVFQLQLMGYKVVLAHPERYLYWYENFSKFEELKNRDVFFQLNLFTFGDVYNYLSKNIAHKMIEHGMVDFVGTDMHSNQQNEFIEKALYEPALAVLIESGNLKNHLL